MLSRICLAIGIIVSLTAPTCLADEAFVRVSPRDARYFELSDGRPYIPIGLNMIAPPRNDFDTMARWMDALAAQGGNFIRVWLDNPYFDVEHERSGVYDAEKAKRIDALLEHARARGIRVNMCIESFRHFGTGNQAWSAKPLHLAANGGPARDIADFFDGARSRAQFKRKLAWYRDRCGDAPAIFGWELWNEINAVAGGDYMAWSEVMLAELDRLFPRNLAMQSLGSYDHERKRANYRRLATMPGNDVAQVHRYLDLGAQLEVCKGPVDVLAADAVRDLLAANPGRPVILAESGAVEPSHSGPFKYYPTDKAGIILHDVLFAPFFAGAAGPGHIWHWDQYVARNDLWSHFGRFAAAVRDIDPAAEQFEPSMVEHPRLRVYVLKGKTTTLVWCRDKENNWMTELRDGKAPEEITGATLDLAGILRASERPNIHAYDPWSGRRSDLAARDSEIRLPSFTRSIVVRIEPAK